MIETLAQMAGVTPAGAILILVAAGVVILLVLILKFGKKVLIVGGITAGLTILLVYGLAFNNQAEATKATATAATVASGGQAAASILWAVLALLALIVAAVLVGGAVALVVVARRRGIGLDKLLAGVLGKAAVSAQTRPAALAQFPAPTVIIVAGDSGNLPDWLAELVSSSGWQGGST